MSKTIAFSVITLLLVACGSNNDPNQLPGNDNISLQPTQKIIAPELLTKANLTLTAISQEDFEAIPYQDAEFRKSKKLCEQSKGYQANQWEGLNECIWAIEQEKINAFKELVSRKNNQLILKTTSGEIQLEHNPKATSGATYYRFIDFLPISNHYLIEENISEQCIQSKLISGIDGSQFRFKGTLTTTKDGLHFFICSPSSKEVFNCSNKLEYYEMGTESILKKWHLPFQNHRIQNLKLIDNNIFLSLLNSPQPKDITDYIKITFLDDK
jgi:hypothetical protein